MGITARKVAMADGTADPGARRLKMEFNTWRPYYYELMNNMGFDPDKDVEAARLLESLLEDHGGEIVEDDVLRATIDGRRTFVIGGGPSVNKEIREYDLDGVLISADAATSALVEAGMRPDIIVTDLDGDVEKQVELNRRGTIVLLHSHGDNMEALRKWVHRFEGRIVPTCQCSPFDDLRNYGGFTDGDRAIYLADHFDASRIFLVGFDFQEDGSAYKTMSEVKVRKLVWAQLLIGLLDNPSIQFIDEDRPILHF